MGPFDQQKGGELGTGLSPVALRMGGSKIAVDLGMESPSQSLRLGLMTPTDVLTSDGGASGRRPPRGQESAASATAHR